MDHRIRILQTIRQGQIGGGESHLLDLVDNLNQSEFEPIVLSFTEGPMIDRLRQMNVCVQVIPTTRPSDVMKWRAVRAFMQQQRIQLVHAHGTRAASNSFWAANSLGLPWLYTVHGWSFHDDQPSLIRQVRVLGERVLIQKATRTISVSASNQATGQRYFPGFQSVVINNGINTERFNPANTYPDIRAELGIDPEAVLLIFVARFTHQKQPLALLRAFAQIASQHPKAHLLMVGDGEQRADALQEVSQWACRDQITFLSFRSDVPALLSAADVYVLPSLWEGLSIALLEAMSMGKAIVATPTDGTVELLTHMQNGILLSANTKQSLPSSLSQIITDSQLRKRLGEAARQTVLTTFTASAMTRQIETLYRALPH